MVGGGQDMFVRKLSTETMELPKLWSSVIPVPVDLRQELRPLLSTT
jgi:hypothetical protein